MMMEASQERIVLCLHYDGTHFYGFQVQAARRTVQGELEAALHAVYASPIRVHPSGRTDTGVHALRQYVHFSQPALHKRRIPPNKLLHALNALLPPDVRVEYSRAVPHGFHARYSAESRTYCYFMRASNTSFAPWRGVFACVSPHTQWNVWMRDAQEFVGSWDFAHFCRGAQVLHKQGKSTVRIITRVSLVKEGEVIKFFIEAQGFLWNMVRTIVGMLMHRARLSTQAYEQLPSVSSILQSERRPPCSIMGRVAPAHGLYLYDVKYNDSYALPHKPVPPSEY